MKIYLDDDIASPVLAGNLRGAGHDVVLPADVGLVGVDDAVHLRRAIRESRVTISRNYEDFRNLHDLVLEAQGHHPGILVVRRDNDPKRNMKPHEIVRAIRNLMAAGLQLPDSYHELNAWR